MKNYKDKVYTESDLISLYIKSKEYCESRDSQYSFLGGMRKVRNTALAGGALMGIPGAKGALKRQAFKSTERKLASGAAGIIAKKSGVDKADVANLMSGAGSLATGAINKKMGLSRKTGFLQGSIAGGEKFGGVAKTKVTDFGNAAMQKAKEARIKIQNSFGSGPPNTSVST